MDHNNIESTLVQITACCLMATVVQYPCHHMASNAGNVHTIISFYIWQLLIGKSNVCDHFITTKWTCSCWQYISLTSHCFHRFISFYWLICTQAFPHVLMVRTFQSLIHCIMSQVALVCFTQDIFLLISKLNGYLYWSYYISVGLIILHLFTGHNSNVVGICAKYGDGMNIVCEVIWTCTCRKFTVIFGKPLWNRPLRQCITGYWSYSMLESAVVNTNNCFWKGITKSCDIYKKTL